MGLLSLIEERRAMNFGRRQYYILSADRIFGKIDDIRCKCELA
jgi:hypothetical protein